MLGSCSRSTVIILLTNVALAWFTLWQPIKMSREFEFAGRVASAVFLKLCTHSCCFCMVRRYHVHVVIRFRIWHFASVNQRPAVGGAQPVWHAGQDATTFQGFTGLPSIPGYVVALSRSIPDLCTHLTPWKMHVAAREFALENVRFWQEVQLYRMTFGGACISSCPMLPVKSALYSDRSLQASCEAVLGLIYCGCSLR